MKYQKLFLYTLFFFSGATSLVYESLWIRTLTLGVGSTSASISMVLSIFFFGLSVGSYLGGKFAKKIKKPIFAYGLMEGLSGIFALLILYPILNFQQILSALPIEDSFSPLFTFIKFAFVFLLLILPTICMGATLPLLIEIKSQNNKEFGKSISFLYALNTFGAVAGAFSTSFLLIPTFGVYYAYILTVFVSLAVLFGSYVLEKKANFYTSKNRNEDAQLVTSNINLSENNNLLYLIISGVVGFSAIAAQVVWNKYLGIYFGTNIFGLGIILSIFLFGIALGSYTLSLFIERVEQKKKLLFFLLTSSFVSVVMTSFLFSVMPILTNTLIYYFSGSMSVVFLKAILSGLFLLPSTFLFGCILPLIIRILSENENQASKATGLAYSINTLGSILGAYVTGLYLIPIIGSSASLKIAVCLLVLSSLALGFKVIQVKWQRFVTVTFVALFSISILANQTISFKNIIKSAYFQNLSYDLSLSDLLVYFSKNYEDFKFVHEGKTAIISLSNDQQDGEFYKQYLRLKTNGLNESIYDMENLDIIPKYEGLLGFLPYLFTRDAKTAFVVGYGGGYSVDFLTQTDLKKVFVSELEEGIIKASQYVYGAEEHPILNRKSLNLKIEDARYALAQNKNSFDIIISQPSHSWLTGVANLFTKEYFEIVKSKLTDKGVFSQWLNLYNMNPDVVQSIFKTFYTTFPHGYVFTNVDDEELIMIGSKQPIKVNYNKLKALADNKHFKNILQNTDLESADDFLTNYAFSRATALSISRNARINTDLNAYAEVQQSKLFYSQRQQEQVNKFLSDNFTSDIYQQFSKQTVDEKEFYNSYLEQLLSRERFDKFFRFLEDLKLTKKHPEIVGKFCLESERYACAIDNFKIAMNEVPNSETLNLYLTTLLALDDSDNFFKVVSKYGQFKNKQTQCYVFDAEIKFKNISKVSKTKINSLKNICGNYLNKSLANYYLNIKSYDLSQKAGFEYIKEHQSDLRVSNIMLALSVIFKDNESYEFYLNHISEIKEDEKSRIDNLISYFKSNGWQKDAELLEAKL